MKRTMESAVPLATVYLIKSLWSPMVSFALLGGISTSAYCNSVGLYDRCTA